MNTDFQNLGNWRQATNDRFDWTLRSGSTPSSNTGPSSGHGGSGWYGDDISKVPSFLEEKMKQLENTRISSTDLEQFLCLL